ncbi:MAG: T9SS type A sorting domain-containing protein [Ignavibacteriota bacterium]
MRILFFTLCLLLISDALLASDDLRSMFAPEEIPSGEDFVVVVAGRPVSKEDNRRIAIEFPENWKFIRAYAAEEGATESTPLELNSEMSAVFTKDKGHTIRVLEDRTRVYSENFDGIAYFFVFRGPAIATSGTFKACFLERSDPGIPERKETKKGKKTKTTRSKNFDWRITSPSISGDFSFAEISGSPFSHTIRFLTGWSNTSRGLIIKDSLYGDAFLNIRPELLNSFFDHGFSLQWWQNTTKGEQTILKFLKADSSTAVVLKLNPFGQLDIRKIPTEADSDIAIISNSITADGAWHQISISCDSLGLLRLFTDGKMEDSVQLNRNYFKDIAQCWIGEPGKPEDFAIDELRFIKRAFTSEKVIISEITVAARDTISEALALFHFEEFGRIARSSISAIIPANDTSSRRMVVPIYFTLDSGATLAETSSPVLFEPAVLTVEQSSPTKVSFNWRITNENGIRRYELQRRIATFGEYETTLSTPVRKGIPNGTNKRSPVSRESYFAAEKLPQLSHAIDLYYRLALIGANDSVIRYIEPVKLEFGGARDVFVEQNKPNPFNPKTTINFRLIKATNVIVDIYDIIGRQIATLFDGKLSAGKHSLDIDATNWLGGIYFYKVKTAKTIVTKKMVLAK